MLYNMMYIIVKYYNVFILKYLSQKIASYNSHQFLYINYNTSRNIIFVVTYIINFKILFKKR